MIQECRFNPVCDVEQVQPDGALDLAQAYALGSIPAGLESSDSDYNGIDDPASIAGKPSDVFEGMQAGKVVESRARKSDEFD